MKREDIEQLLYELDSYARSVCRYEYGLPTYNNDFDGLPNHLDEMVKIVMKCLGGCLIE